ncbi:MAG: hypothetical protein ACRCYX_04670 [Dermatophilaceae bacterium]
MVEVTAAAPAALSTGATRVRTSATTAVPLRNNTAATHGRRMDDEHPAVDVHRRRREVRRERRQCGARTTVRAVRRGPDHNEKHRGERPTQNPHEFARCTGHNTGYSSS